MCALENELDLIMAKLVLSTFIVDKISDKELVLTVTNDRRSIDLFDGVPTPDNPLYISRYTGRLSIAAGAEEDPLDNQLNALRSGRASAVITR